MRQSYTKGGASLLMLYLTFRCKPYLACVPVFSSLLWTMRYIVISKVSFKMENKIVFCH
jgi:hypothetical protein